MNHIMRKTVLPWHQLSGMGNWSYAVVTDWVDPRDGSVMAGSMGPQVFEDIEEAKDCARDYCKAWPYRSEACFLTDSGKYIPLSC